jgi:hypothetical protein
LIAATGEISRDALPPGVVAVLEAGEAIHWTAQPIRQAMGRGIYFTAALGALFTVSSVLGFIDAFERGVLKAQSLWAIPVLGVAALFVGFSIFLLTWPIHGKARLRRTHQLITDRRVLEVRLSKNGDALKVRAFRLEGVEEPTLARRRGDSVTLVLRERLRQRRSDGRTIYEWDALHGMARGEEALLVLKEVLAQRATLVAEPADGHA